MTPIIVRALGNYDYGIWEIIISVVGYMGLLDLGLKPAIVRFVARYNAMENKVKLHKLYSSAMFFMGLMGLLAFIILAVWAVLNPEILAKKGSDPARYFFLLLMIGTQVLISFPGYVPECFHDGFQRYHLENSINLGITLLVSSVLFILLQNGHGLLVLALVTTIGIAIRMVTHLTLLASSRYGNFRFRRKDISWTSVKELLAFGYKSLIQGVAGNLINNTDSIVIGAFLGPMVVAFYIIPFKLIAYIRGLVMTVTQVFMPLFSDLDARGDKAKSAQVLTVASKYVVGFIMPIFLSMYFLGIPFLARWMGPEFAEKGRLVMFILIPAYGVMYLNPFHNRFLTGIGRHGILAKIKSAIAVLNLILSLILIQFFGKEGVALGTLIPLVIFEPVVLYFTCKYVGITMWGYIRQVLLPLIVPILFFVAMLWKLSSSIVLVSYSSIFGVGISSILVYSLLFFTISLQKEEKQFILGKVKTRLA
jgi:O-antigen/teichoic acid export membrane protein